MKITADEIPIELLNEINKHRYKIKSRFSASNIQYSLMLRNASLQSYKLLPQETNVPSVSYRRKIKQGIMNQKKMFENSEKVMK